MRNPSAVEHRSVSRSGRVMIAAGAVIAAAGAAVLLFYAWRAHRFNQWVMADAARLAPYEVILFPESRRVVDDSTRIMDDELMRKTLEGRLAVELTRSEYYWGVGNEEAWVKTLLITSKPGEETAQRKLNLLNRLEKTNEQWKVTAVEELAIP